MPGNDAWRPVLPTACPMEGSSIQPMVRRVDSRVWLYRAVDAAAAGVAGRRRQRPRGRLARRPALDGPTRTAAVGPPWTGVSVGHTSQRFEIWGLRSLAKSLPRPLARKHERLEMGKSCLSRSLESVRLLVDKAQHFQRGERAGQRLFGVRARGVPNVAGMACVLGARFRE